MIRHIFKITWKNKKGKALLIVQFVFAFIVIYCLFVLGIKLLENYFRPVGFSHSQLLDIGSEALENPKGYSIEEKQTMLHQMLEVVKNTPEIENYALIKDFVPFAKKAPVRLVEGEHQNLESHIWKADDKLADILELEMIAGRWFSAVDNAANTKPAIINRDLAKEMFNSENPIGKKITLAETNYQIIGVVQSFYPNNSTVYNGIFLRNTLGTSDFEPNVSIVAKAKQTVGVRFIIDTNDLLSKVAHDKKDKRTYINRFSMLREREWSGNIILIILLGFVVVFLITNLLLGLVGTLRNNIKKRLHEIGVRRACGSPKSQIITLIIGELYALLTFSLIPSVFIIFQFFIFNLFQTDSTNYTLSLFGSAVLLYLLVAVISAYPASVAVSATPAGALHEE